MFVYFPLIYVVMNLITAIERVPPSDLVSDELDLLLKRTQRGLVVLEQVGVCTDRHTNRWTDADIDNTTRILLYSTFLGYIFSSLVSYVGDSQLL